MKRIVLSGGAAALALVSGLALAQGAPESLEGFPEVGCQKGGKQCATTFEKGEQQIAVRLGTTLAGQPFVQSAD